MWNLVEKRIKGRIGGLEGMELLGVFRRVGEEEAEEGLGVAVENIDRLHWEIKSKYTKN